MLGNFMADGSFYTTKEGNRFEFVDGTPYKKELKYSLEHISKIKRILEFILNKKLSKIRKRENKFCISIRSKYLSDLFINSLKIHPGKKYKIIDIPQQYKNSIYEKAFWQGYIDGDGSISRKYKKISVESMSKDMINSFSEYLSKNNILFSKYKSKRGKDYSYVIIVRSVSLRDFAKKVGFVHPLKSRLLLERLNKKDFFIENNIINTDNILFEEMIDYTKMFDSSVFIENGRNIFEKFGDKGHLKSNKKLNDIIYFLENKGLEKGEILKEINQYRFKKSKGTKNSVRLPLILEDNILKLAKFVRIRSGSISFSRSYIESFNENFNEILKLTKNIFDIEPKYTCKNEPLFCSGVLSDFFNNITKRNQNLNSQKV
jgi:hypothetical protein